MKCVKGKCHLYSENVGLQGHDVNHRAQRYSTGGKNKKQRQGENFKITRYQNITFTNIWNIFEFGNKIFICRETGENYLR